MKKLLITALMVCIAWGAIAQAVDTSKVDLSKAEMSLAGPDKVYVSNIYYGDIRLSVLLKYNGATGATIYGPYLDEDKFVLDSFELGQADLRLLGDSTLIISDLVLYGAGVSGRFKYDGVYTINYDSHWITEKPVDPETQLANLAAQLRTAQTRYEQDLAAAEAKAAADVGDLEADIEKLEASVASYEREISALKRRIVTASAQEGDSAGRLLERMMFAEPVDKSKINLSKAEMSLAGPDSLYVTNLYYGDIRMSVILKYDGMTGATIFGPYYDNEKLLIDSFEMGYADVNVVGENTIVISDLVLYGQGVTGRFEYDGRSTLNLNSWWQSLTPKTLEARLAEADSKFKTLQIEHEDLEETLNALYARIDIGRKDYEDQIAALNRTITVGKRNYDNRIADLESQLKDAGVEVVSVAAPTMAPTTTVASGTARGSSLSGSWQASAASATQSDASQYFAKYTIPLNQSADQTLYSFTARAANATDFVGYGFHLFVSGDRSKLSWGLGNSYLIWLTRDPKYYRNDNTHVQVYRSFDDVTMVQVASVSTSENIERSNDIEILYDKAMGRISVSVNGTEYVSYDVADVLRTGSKVAFRTLGGPVTFSNFEVKAQ